MSMGSSQPPVPSPQQVLNTSEQGATAQLQQQNIPAQAGSQYNQSNPYGSLNYNQIGTGPGGVPLYSANTSLSPVEQGLFNQFTGTQQQAGGQAANALGFGNYGSISPSQQIGDMTSGRTGQLMNTWLGSQIPFFNTQTQQLDTQLRNQGLQPGNPAYDVAMRQLDVNQGLGVAGAASQFEPAAFNQATQLYGLPMNVGQQLAQWGAPQGPQSMFTSQLPGLQPGSIQGIAGPMQQAYLAQAEQQQAQANAQNQMIAGLFGLGGNIIGQGVGGYMTGQGIGAALAAV